tara:strand:- start:25587 stop:26723 length:1137 start_codon:yes stop_codon:yes gene_type:complete
MAITIDRITRVINVPKTFSTLIQSVPKEIRQLDLNAFRKALKDIEDNGDGMSYLDTHRHNTTVEVGGVILSRVIEIINGYTVTFEDGAYAINLAGANSNVGDIVNVNQVSVRSANSAGLQDLSTLLSAAYNNTVVLDTTKGQAGTSTPVGTRSTPCNNANDAVVIAETNGIDSISVVGSYVFSTGEDISNFRVIGQNMTLSNLVVLPGSVVTNCEFSDCHLMGTLDGGSTVERSLITDLSYTQGFLYKCVLSTGTITLGASTHAVIMDCYSGVVAPTIDMGGSGQDLIIRNYNGALLITNKTGSDLIDIDLQSGKITLDNTVVAGVITVRGDGKLVDTSGNYILTGAWNGATIINETNSVLADPTLDSIANAVWNEVL